MRMLQFRSASAGLEEMSSYAKTVDSEAAAEALRGNSEALQKHCGGRCGEDEGR